MGFLSDEDRSDSQTICRRVDDITDLSRLAYYAIKLIKILGPAA